MLKDWEIIHEMDNEDGTPTGYARAFGGQLWWVTKFPDGWYAETKVQALGDEPEFVKVKKFRSPKTAATWVENHRQEWTKSAWD